MELIDNVRDYLQLVIERLEGMSRLNGLNLNISELKKEASRLSSIIVQRDNFDSNVKVLGSEYTVSRIAIKGSLSTLHVHLESGCEKYDDGCNCFSCWLYRGSGFYHFQEMFYREGIINDLIVQHHNMILLLKDKNSTKEGKELADSQRELTLTIAKQIFLKEYNKYKQQKIKDYEASKQ